MWPGASCAWMLRAGRHRHRRSARFSLDQFIRQLAGILEWSCDQHRTRRLPQDAIDVRSEQGKNSKAGALRADANQIDFVSFGIVNDLAIRLAFTHDVFDLAPQVRFV